MKKFKKYSSGLFTKLLELLAQFEQTADQETLHKIRITIKKIRSLFRLISYCDNKFNDRKQFSPLKKIFKDAGLIRDNYIAAKLIKKYGINPDSNKINLLSGNEKRMEHISSFVRNTNRNCKIVLKRYLSAEKYLANVSDECYNEYCITKKTELRNLIYPDLIEAKLHNARMICKEITFIKEMDKNSKNKDDVLFYDKLQDLIGEWHDKIELSKIISIEKRNNEYYNFEELESGIGSDQKSIKELVNDFYG